eukprot:2172405-Pleurochrysis_carterae.AAC.2
MGKWAAFASFSAIKCVGKVGSRQGGLRTAEQAMVFGVQGKMGVTRQNGCDKTEFAETNDLA